MSWQTSAGDSDWDAVSARKKFQVSSGPTGDGGGGGGALL